MSELLPCPFCGGEASVLATEYPCVYCMSCQASSEDFDTIREAIEAWNTRAERTCEGCVHKQPCYDFEPLCETCARHWPDLYEEDGE